MSKSDHKFVNTSQDFELADWLYRNDYSKKKENIILLKDIIDNKVKKGDTTDNITWDELDAALANNPEWFSGLVGIDE